MRAALALLALLLAPPLAHAGVCVGGACWGDGSTSAPAPCEGSWSYTGAWASAGLAYAYVLGEERHCARPWGDTGATGLRAGASVAGVLLEARWQERHLDGRCEVGVEAWFSRAARDCPAPPPELPWGDLLP